MINRDWPSDAHQLATTIYEIARIHPDEKQAVYDAEQILNFSQHPSYVVRAQVAMSILKIHKRTPAALITLQKLLCDSNSIVQAVARRVLPEIVDRTTSD